MKRILISLLLIVFISCDKEEHGKKLTYPYIPEEQSIVVNLDVYYTEDVELKFTDMLLEVNADYYNRYGIAVNLNLRGVFELPEEVGVNGRLFLPNEGKRKNTIDLYIIPQHKLTNSAAYAITNRKIIVLGSNYQTTRTLAHEIGHIFMLGHVDIPNNVMKLQEIARQYETPNDFTEDQIAIINKNIDLTSISKVTNLPILIYD